MSVAMHALAVEQVSRRFGDVQALDALSLAVPAGGVFGLLGPNGAGKTTLLRIVTGLVYADGGAVRLFGEPAGPATRRRIGAFIEAPAFYPFLGARETIAVLARVSGVDADPDALLERVGLGAAADRKVGGFSLGMKQRLAIAAALAARPELLILDEPTNGLDPEGILEMRRLVRELADRDGLTVLLSSHLLDEVERVCDRVAILNRGRLAAEGSVAELLGDSERLWLDVRPVGKVLAILGEHGAAEAGGVAAQIGRDEAPALIAALAAQGVEIFEARWIRRDLEAVFLAETGGGA
ncbi:ABC transporter ATP-binding protein [Sphingomonas sp. G-3-2-10]|nr:ABC transporter ATP-binding protein [Sphingomonas sp. G-3-2-10]